MQRPDSTVLAQARERHMARTWESNRLTCPGPDRAPSHLGSATLSSMTIRARVTAHMGFVLDPQQARRWQENTSRASWPRHVEWGQHGHRNESRTGRQHVIPPESS